MYGYRYNNDARRRVYGVCRPAKPKEGLDLKGDVNYLASFFRINYTLYNENKLRRMML